MQKLPVRKRPTCGHWSSCSIDDDMNHFPIACAGIVLMLSGCEPERGIRADRDFSTAVSVDCINHALVETFGKIERWDYVSDGHLFPKGTEVAQFAYYSLPDGAGWATIKVGFTEQGTRVVHDFTRIGTELPQSVFPPALKAIGRANRAVEQSCQVDLDDMEMREIGQNVEALH